MFPRSYLNLNDNFYKDFLNIKRFMFKQVEFVLLYHRYSVSLYQAFRLCMLCLLYHLRICKHMLLLIFIEQFVSYFK